MQIEHYRQMTGEQRLKIALDLHECRVRSPSRAFRHQFPQADEAEIDRRLRERICMAYE